MAGSTWLAAIVASIWLYLLLFRGGFWLLREQEDRGVPAAPDVWPSIAAVIPARDEAALLPMALASLLDQSFPGDLRIFVVDDHSSDGTAEVARKAAADRGAGERVQVVPGADLPIGWTGKLWAVSQGVACAQLHAPDYILLTDADIVFGPGALDRLVRRACAGRFVLTSAMVKLRCDSFAERLLIPAFVFFFRMLYPFRWVNDPASRTAAAAGGCMLIKREILAAAGGMASVKSALIDDCALGARLKREGPVWLGLSKGIVSLRPYPGISDVGSMIARSAYAQLNYSPLMLLGCVAGMSLVFLAPPALAFFAGGAACVLGLASWAAMAAALAPMRLFYGMGPFGGLALPAIAFIYLAYTLRSAVEHKLGRGGMWKGRAQAISEA